MYYGNLRRHKEYIFRQSSFGSEGHIAIDASEFLHYLQEGPPYPELRIDTWCGKNLKYGNYSNLTERNAGVRNACEYCFVEYDPEDQVATRKAKRAERKISESDLPW